MQSRRRPRWPHCKIDAFLEESYQLNAAGMKRMIDAFGRLQLDFVPSYGNFVLVKVGDAGRIYEQLLKRGVIVRPVANYGLPEWLRITIGLPEENERLVQALTDSLKRVRRRSDCGSVSRRVGLIRSEALSARSETWPDRIRADQRLDAARQGNSAD